MSALRHDPLGAHRAECDLCRVLDPPLADIAAALDAVRVEVDVNALSRQVMTRLAPVLTARARAAFWRQLARVLGVALLPLPVLIAVDVVLLVWLYGQMVAWLPIGVATYLIGSYAAAVLVSLGLAYALIPLLLGRGAPIGGGAGREVKA